MSRNSTIDARHLWLAGLGSLVMARRQAGKTVHGLRSQAMLRAKQARNIAVDGGYIARGLAMTLQEQLQARLRRA